MQYFLYIINLDMSEGTFEITEVEDVLKDENHIDYKNPYSQFPRRLILQNKSLYKPHTATASFCYRLYALSEIKLTAPRTKLRPYVKLIRAYAKMQTEKSLDIIHKKSERLSKNLNNIDKIIRGE